MIHRAARESADMVRAVTVASLLLAIPPLARPGLAQSAGATSPVEVPARGNFPGAKPIEVKFDRFSQISTVRLAHMQAGVANFELAAFFTFKGPVLSEPAMAAEMMFMASNNSWKYLYSYDTRFLLDGSEPLVPQRKATYRCRWRHSPRPCPTRPLDRHDY